MYDLATLNCKIKDGMFHCVLLTALFISSIKEGP